MKEHSRMAALSDPSRASPSIASGPNGQTDPLEPAVRLGWCPDRTLVRNILRLILREGGCSSQTAAAILDRPLPLVQTHMERLRFVGLLKHVAHGGRWVNVLSRAGCSALVGLAQEEQENRK
jgi:hypothetical protein